MTATVLPFEAEQETLAQPETPTPAAPTPEAQPVSIKRPTLLLNLKLQKPGKTRKGDLGQIDTDADRSALRLSKELLNSPELDRVEKEDAKLRQWLYTRALPSMFRAGIHRLPLELITETDERLKQHQADRADLVDTFCSAYPERKDEARRRLASQFRDEDYPATDEIRQAFRMEWNYFVFSTPESIGGISEEIYRRERIKAMAQAQAEAEQIRGAMRQLFAEIVDHMVDRLSAGDDGKPKVFRDSMIEKFRDFCGTFQARNVTDDDALNALVSRAQAIVGSYSPEALRSSTWTRETVRKGLEAIKPALDSMVADAPRRGIILD